MVNTGHLDSKIGALKSKVYVSGPPPGMPPPTIPPPGFQHPHPPPEAFDYGEQHQHQPDYEFYGSGYEPTQESQWSVPPPGFDGPPPQQPQHSDAPPGDAGYEGGAERDPWGQRDSRRHSRGGGDSPPPPPRRGGRDYSRLVFLAIFPEKITWGK